MLALKDPPAWGGSFSASLISFAFSFNDGLSVISCLKWFSSPFFFTEGCQFITYFLFALFFHRLFLASGDKECIYSFIEFWPLRFFTRSSTLPQPMKLNPVGRQTVNHSIGSPPDNNTIHNCWCADRPFDRKSHFFLFRKLHWNFFRFVSSLVLSTLQTRFWLIVLISFICTSVAELHCGGLTSLTGIMSFLVTIAAQERNDGVTALNSANQ
jgi:hypothetical protein